MKKILVVHTWGMGDIILATPMLKSLHLSGYSVDLVLFSLANQTVLQENDFLHNIYVVKKWYEMIKFFKRYDYLISTAGVNPQKVKKLNLLVRAKAVYSGVQERDIHRIDMNLNISKPLLKTITKEPYIYIKKSDEVVEKYLTAERNVGFAIGSGAKQKFKRWDKFEELIEKVDGNKLVFIGLDELDLEDRFKKYDVKIVKESLEDTIKIISKLDLLVGNDNGLMHIGYASGIDTITIYGMTNQKETGGYRQNNKAVFLEMDCRPCFDPTTDNIGCDTLDCLRDLSVQNVLEKC